MPGVNSIRSGWRCDSCGEPISHLQAGWVEWVSAEDSRGKLKVSGLQLVHRRDTSLTGRELYGCQYNPRDEFRKNYGIVEGLPLDRFAGTDGLMLLFSMIAERELPLRDLIELAKRVQIPGYEAVHEVAHDAVDAGAIAPVIGLGFYLQCEIWNVLNWVEYQTSSKNPGRENRCVVSH